MQVRALIAIMLVGLALRIGYAAAIYEPSLLTYNLDDFVSYRNAATDILDGDLAFTNSLYMKRPPVYSIMVAVLGIQPFLVIAANIALGIAIIPLTYLLGRQLKLSIEVSSLAAFIVALDPTSIRASVVLRADAMADFWLVLAFVGLLYVRQAETVRAAVFFGFIASSFIMMSALTRPAAYLLWIPMGFWLLFTHMRWRVPAVAAMAAVGFAVVNLWSHHNGVYFNNPTFSSAGTFQLLYVRAASVLHQATDEDIDDVYAELAIRVEERLGNDVQDITSNWRHRHLASTSKQAAAMTDIAVEIFLRYPVQYILTIPVGVYRALFPVNSWPLWNAIVFNLAFLLTSAYGLAQMARARRISDAFYLVLPCVYFLAGTLLVATASFDTRARVMVTPLLAIMAAHGVMRLLNRRRAASASPSPPAGS